MIATERPHGVFSRQLFLGDNLDTARAKAEYDEGVLQPTTPIVERAKPPKIEIAGNVKGHFIRS